jgi:hypothetical protein
MSRIWLTCAAVAFGLAAWGGSAAAAPLANLGESLQSNQATAAVEPVAYRRCWRHRGHLHCRRTVVRRYYYDGAPYYGYGYGYAPYYDYGPSFGLYFGGGGGRHFHGHHHR